MNHPVIRIICFLLLVLFLVTGNALQLVVSSLLIGLAYAWARPSSYGVIMTMLRRSRWLIVSIGIVYFWFTPGTPVLGEMQLLSGVWLPTFEGIRLGLARILVILMIVLAIALLLQTSTRNELLSAILWLLSPLALVGISYERLAVRLALSLDAVAQVQNLISQNLQIHRAELKSKTDWRVFAHDLYKAVLARADAAPCELIAIPRSASPSVLQWSFPLILALFLFVVQFI